MAHSRPVRWVIGFLILTLAAAAIPLAPANAAPPSGGQTVTPSATNGETCNTAAGALSIFSTHTCTADNADADKAVAKQSSWSLGGHLAFLVNEFNKVMSFAGAAMSTAMAKWILTKELGTTNSLNSPKLVDPSAPDHNSWFLGELAVIRSIGLYFIVPMLMLVAIQSIVRGSLYFLLRATFVLLPVAVIGGIAFVAVVQLFSNIADDMAAGIANYSVNINDWGDHLRNTLENIGVFGLFTWIWLFVFIFAAFAIYIELILREVGIYLAVLFLPLAFAAMVWPPASRYVRRLSELLLGLIFSKVFIIGAFSLGLAAFGHMDSNGGSSGGVTAIATGAITMVTAAFAGAKILTFTPAAVGSAQGYVLNRRQITARGTKRSQTLKSRLNKQQTRSKNVKPVGPFQN